LSKFFCFGEPFVPEVREHADETEDNLRIVAEFKQRMNELIEDVRVNKLWLWSVSRFGVAGLA
jgi:hypothetical protein